MPKSLTLSEKFDKIFNELEVKELDALLEIASSQNNFSSESEFKQHLMEGALLNVNFLASKALSIPCGEYMVWMTDAGHTMLVPTSGKKSGEVFEHTTDQYDVFTTVLMQNWNKLERTLAEDLQHTEPGEENEYSEPHDEGDEDENGLQSKVDASTVDRLPILRAMEDHGFTVSSLAAEVGVDPPAISRILRTPKDTQGDPGGRNPSMGLASQICSALRIDPTAAFPDIFNTNTKYKPRNQPGNRGSGMDGAASGSTRKGNATQKWTRGNG